MSGIRKASYKLLIFFICFSSLLMTGIISFEYIKLRLKAIMIGGTYIDSQDVVFQQQEKDCGPAALQMILKHYNIRADVSSLSSRAKETNEGTSMWILKNLAEKHGLKVKAKRINFDSHKKQMAPLLIRINNCHFVVLDSISDEYVFIRDPKIGRIKFLNKNFIKIWDGESLVFGN